MGGHAGRRQDGNPRRAFGAAEFFRYASAARESAARGRAGLQGRDEDTRRRQDWNRVAGPRDRARAAPEASLKYAQGRLPFRKPLSQYQAIQWKLADMAVEIDAARLLTHRAATLKDRGEACTKESAMAKLFAAETAMKSATEAVQIHGGYGYTKEFKVERFFRDAKITEIYEGTSEIQRLVIAGSVLESR